MANSFKFIIVVIAVTMYAYSCMSADHEDIVDVGNEIFINTLSEIFDNNGSVKACGDHGVFVNATKTGNFSCFLDCVHNHNPNVTTQIAKENNITVEEIKEAVHGALVAIYNKNCSLTQVVHKCPPLPPPLPGDDLVVNCAFLACTKVAIRNSQKAFPQCAGGISAFIGVADYYLEQCPKP